MIRNPWVQLVVGIVCMAMIANLQYGWTVFVTPIQDKQGWSLAAIPVSFTIFVLVETWLVPFEAAFVDRYGPRVMVRCSTSVEFWPVSAPASSTARASATR
jgi:OFA family oxalate/formate antiporter-like MFS transporter